MGIAHVWSDPAGYGRVGSYTLVDWSDDHVIDEVWKGTGASRKVFAPSAPEFKEVEPYFESILARAPRDREYWPEDAPSRGYMEFLA